jgi:hypothetical protein
MAMMAMTTAVRSTKAVLIRWLVLIDKRNRDSYAGNVAAFADRRYAEIGGRCQAPFPCLLAAARTHGCVPSRVPFHLDLSVSTHSGSLLSSGRREMFGQQFAFLRG